MVPKELNYKELPGLSERQLSEHHDVLYAGYVKKVNELEEAFGLVGFDSANATFSEVREIKMEQGFALNAVILHEFYFENLGGDGVPTGKSTQVIEKAFGSFEKWMAEFTALGMSARGWVVMAKDNKGKLHNFICDAHNQGGIWGMSPVLVLDVYEHAYFIDYGTNRKEYIEVFMKNINWNVVEKRIGS